MKEEKRRDDAGKHNVEQPRRDDDHVDPREDVPRSLEEAAHHDHSKHDQPARSVEEEQEKILVVHVADTIADPGAVMVHSCNTRIAS